MNFERIENSDIVVSNDMFGKKTEYNFRLSDDKFKIKNDIELNEKDIKILKSLFVDTIMENLPNIDIHIGKNSNGFVFYETNRSLPYDFECYFKGRMYICELFIKDDLEMEVQKGYTHIGSSIDHLRELKTIGVYEDDKLYLIKELEKIIQVLKEK